MQRDKHLFQFTGKQISEAAHAEAQYHADRIGFWIEEHDSAIEQARAKGIEVREYPVTGGTRAAIVIDATLQERINECYGKIQSHTKRADDLKIQAACYGTQLDRHYDLHPDDVIYFRLAGGPRDD